MQKPSFPSCSAGNFAGAGGVRSRLPPRHPGRAGEAPADRTKQPDLKGILIQSCSPACPRSSSCSPAVLAPLCSQKHRWGSSRAGEGVSSPSLLFSRRALHQPGRQSPLPRTSTGRAGLSPCCPDDSLLIGPIQCFGLADQVPKAPITHLTFPNRGVSRGGINPGFWAQPARANPSSGRSRCELEQHRSHHPRCGLASLCFLPTARPGAAPQVTISHATAGGACPPPPDPGSKARVLRGCPTGCSWYSCKPPQNLLWNRRAGARTPQPKRGQ